MTLSTSRPRRREARKDLLARTALCGALAALAASPAFALPVALGSSEVSTGGVGPGILNTGAQTQVTLGAQRTIIDWATFNVDAAESVKFTFGARNWIVLNRIQSLDPSDIEGQVQGVVGGAFGGNIWFSAPGGMIFGSGAQIDAGGLLATSARVTDSTFLDPANTLFAFPDGDAGAAALFAVRSGAQINGHGGLVAIIGPEIQTEAGAAITGTGGSSVLYGGAINFQLRLAPNTAGDFDLVDFIVPKASAGASAVAPLDLQAATTANSVFVASVSRTAIGSAVINLQGLVTAQAANSDGGDIILSGGGGITARQPGAPVSGAVPTDIYLNASSASRDFILQTNGQVFNKPYVKPPPDPCVTDPASCETDDNSGGCPITFPNCAPILSDGVGRLVASQLRQASGFDPTAISSTQAGRSVKLVATRDISLGSIRAGLDLAINGRTITANAVSAGGALNLASTGGDIVIAGLAVGLDATVTSTANVTLGQLAAPSSSRNQLSITAAQDINIGTGATSFTGAGTVNLTGNNITVNSTGSATIGTVRSRNIAKFQADNLTIGSIVGGRVLAQAGSVRVGSINSGTDAYVVSTAGDATLGSAVVGDDVFVLANGGTASLGAATLTGTGIDAVGLSFAGNPDTLNGRIALVKSTGGDARLGLGTGTVTGADSVTVQATQDVFVDILSAVSGSLSILAGRNGSFTAPSVNFSTVMAGRDVSLFTTAGDFTSLAPLVAAHSISLGASGLLHVGDVTAGTGSITLTGSSVTAGAVSAAQDLALKATGPAGVVQVTSYRAGEDVTLQGAVLNLGSAIAPVGRDLSIITPGDLNLAQDLSAGRSVTVTSGGAANLQNLTASAGAVQITGTSVTARAVNAAQAVTVTSSGGVTLGSINAGTAQITAGALNLPGAVNASSVRLLANDLTLGGTVTASTIQVESRTGALQVGGAAAPGGGMWIDNAEFSRLHAGSQLNLYAGSSSGGATGDLTLGDLDVNPLSAPLVTLYAAAPRNVLVQGLVAPTTSGGAFRIGDPSGTVWRPTSILITGGLGAATYSGGVYSNARSFADLRLFAAQDILMGSPRFISLIQATPASAIQVDANRPAGVAPTAAEQNHVFVAADQLELSATGKVVQQNTSTNIDQPAGMFLTPKTATALTIDPPQVVNLFFSFRDPTGKVVSSVTAKSGFSFVVVDSAGRPTTPPAGASYRINGCDVGAGSCVALVGDSSGLDNFQQQGVAIFATLSDAKDAASEAGSGTTSALVNPPPALLGVAQPNLDEIVLDPVVTGSGNEEVWRKRRASQ